MKIAVLYDDLDPVGIELWSSISKNVILPDEECELVNVSSEVLADCTGCFGCWTRTPGICILKKDGGAEFLKKIYDADFFIVISKITWGGYSWPIKAYVDRTLPLVHPFFRKVGGEMHHKRRYASSPLLLAIGYGAENGTEEETFITYTEAHRDNMSIKAEEGTFIWKDDSSVNACSEWLRNTQSGKVSGGKGETRRSGRVVEDTISKRDFASIQVGKIPENSPEMKIIAVNGSPKGEQSNSREVISILQAMHPVETKWTVISQKTENEFSSGQFFDAAVLLIAFPLYVDGIPASLMRFLERYGQEYKRWRGRNKKDDAKAFPKQRVFAVANCGFYEGIQNMLALKMIEHFCDSAGLIWSGGVGLGTGEMIRELRMMPQKAGIRKPIITALKAVADAIVVPDARLSTNIYTQHAFPWILYKLVGEMGWRKQIKKNGQGSKALGNRPLES
jgi:multimeric flavodoxin WrbA